MRNVYLDFYAWFLKLYLYTSSTSDVSGRINEVKLREKVEEWFSDKSCNAGTLAMGIKLHREYVAILQETGTIIIRRN